MFRVITHTVYIWLIWCGNFAGALMSSVYEEKKDDDGFLYVTYSGENTFGFGSP